MAYTTIDKPTDYFRTKLYTGNGTNDTAITWDETDTNMQPNWLWIKNRSEGDQSHALFDSVRGATKRLSSNENSAEGTEATNLDSFDSNGFTVDNEVIVNGSSDLMVAWGWKAGTSVSGNTTGSGTAKAYTGSVSTTAGFSIIRYLGNGTDGHTIPHHLGVAPKMIIVKSTAGSRSWIVLPPVTDGHDKDLKLNDTDAIGDSDVWNNVAPSSTVFSVGSNAVMNANDVALIAYCFAPKQGYSKFGSYTGNGNADGTFIYTGFKPAFVMIKATDAVKSWMILDNKRNPAGLSGANTIRYRLSPNTNAATSDNGDGHDFYSNGFKHFGTDTSTNQNGTNYIYMAFAENPFATSTGVPATAR